MRRLKAGLVLSLIAAATIATPAAAYIGPGVGLGVIATIFGSIAAFFMVLAGLIWYPFKVMLRKRREKKEAAQAPTSMPASNLEAKDGDSLS